MADNIKKVTIKFDIDTAALAKGEQIVTAVFEGLNKSAKQSTVSAATLNTELQARDVLHKKILRSMQEVERTEKRLNNTKWLSDEVSMKIATRKAKELSDVLEQVRNQYLQIELTAGRAASAKAARTAREISAARQSIADVGRTNINEALQDQAKLVIPGVAEYQKVQEQLAAREVTLAKQVKEQKINVFMQYLQEYLTLHERLYKNVEAKQLDHLRRLTANNIAARDDRGYIPQAQGTVADKRALDAQKVNQEQLSTYQQYLRGREAALKFSIDKQLATERYGINSIQVERIKAADATRRLDEQRLKLQERVSQRVASGQIKAASAMQRNAIIERHYQRAVLQSNEALNAKEKALGNNVRQHDAMLLRVGKLIISYNLLRTAYHRFMEGLRNIPEAGIRQQQSEAAVLATFGTVDGSQNLKELRELADYAGASIRDLEESYRRFAPSAILAGATLEQTNQIFRDFTETSTVLHLSTVQTTSLFLALEQMFAKNVVQSEEIKKQLGNVLPGAVEVGAKAWASYTKEVDESGKAVDRSVAGFMKAMQNNMVLAREFVPAFAEMYRDMFGGPDDSIFLEVRTQLFSNFKRLLNEYETFSRGMFDLTGDAMNDALKGIASGLHTLNENLHGTMQIVELLGSLFLARLGIAAVRSIGTLASNLFAVNAVVDGIPVGKVHSFGKAWTWVKTTLVGIPALFNPIVVGTLAAAAATTKLAMMQQGMEVTYGRFTSASRDTIKQLMETYSAQGEGAQEAGYQLEQLTEKSNSWFIQTKSGAVELSTVWDVVWGKITKKAGQAWDLITDIIKLNLKKIEVEAKAFASVMKGIFAGIASDVTDTLTERFAESTANMVAIAEATKTLAETKSISASIDTFNEVKASKKLEYISQIQKGFEGVGAAAAKAGTKAGEVLTKGSPLAAAAQGISTLVSDLEKEVQAAQAKINAAAQKKALDKSQIGGIDPGEQGDSINEALISAREKAEISALRALGENAKADRMLLEKEFGATVRIAKDTVARLKDIQQSGGSLLPAQQTELEENEKFVKNYGILLENVGNKATKSAQKGATGVRDAYRASLQDIANDAQTLRDNLKFEIDEISYLFQHGAVSVEEYFKTKFQAQQSDIAIQRQVLEQQQAVAFAQKDQTKFAQVQRDLIKLGTQAKREELAIDRERLEVLKQEREARANLNIEILRIQGKTGQAERMSFLEQNKDLIQRSIVNKDFATYDKLMDVAQYKTAMGEMQGIDAQREIVTAKHSRTMAELNALQQAGVMGQIEFMRISTQANQERLRQLELLYQREQQATEQIPELLRNPAQEDKLANMRTEIEQLRTTANSFQMFIQNELSNSLANAFEGFLSGSMTARQAMKAFADDVLRQAYRVAANEIAKALIGLAVNAIVSAAGSSSGGGIVDGGGNLSGQINASAGFAKGGAFGKSGELHAFAKGGVVNQPTLFKFAKGTGLMGEAGPEAILPLKRLSSGKLGVQADLTGTGGGGGSVIIENLTVNVQEKEDSTTAEQAEQIGKALRAQLQGMMKQEIASSIRPGNTLNPVSPEGVY
jgi:tape measure domain-containing protein